MKFTSTRQNMNFCCAAAEKITGKNLTLPVLQNTLVRADKKNSLIKLSSTDLEMGVEVESHAKVEEDGEITIPTRLMSGFIRELPNENIEVEEKNKKITVRCGNYRSTIKGEASDEFPIIPDPAPENDFLIAQDEFAGGISSVINSVSLLDIKPEISGVYIQLNENEAIFTATDSFRLSEKTINIADKNYKNKYSLKAILPKKVCDSILKIFQNPSALLRVHIADNQVVIRNDPADPHEPRIRFIGRVISGEYPAYEQIIPKKFLITASIPKNDFVQRVRAASLFSNKINEVICFLNAKKQQLEISSGNQDYGDYTAHIPCKIEGPEEKITLNFQYLLDGMQNITSELIRFSANQAATPVLLEPEGSIDFKYLLMPIKI